MMLFRKLFGQRRVENGEVGASFRRRRRDKVKFIIYLLTIRVFGIEFGFKGVLFQVRHDRRDH
jgi:phage terminase large subunit